MKCECYLMGMINFLSDYNHYCIGSRARISFQHVLLKSREIITRKAIQRFWKFKVKDVKIHMNKFEKCVAFLATEQMSLLQHQFLTFHKVSNVACLTPCIFTSIRFTLPFNFTLKEHHIFLFGLGYDLSAGIDIKQTQTILVSNVFYELVHVFTTF